MSPTRPVRVFGVGGSVLSLFFAGVFVLCRVAVAGGDVDQLYHAAGKGDVASVRQLIAAGTDVNAKSGDGSQALNAAAVYNQHDVIKLLLAHGANPNVRNREGDTPLVCATKYAGGDPTTVKLLVDAGTNLGIADNDGKTALDYAMQQNQQGAVALLQGSK